MLISSYLPAGDTGGDAPAEDVALNFSKIQFTYTPQNADRSADEPVSAGFDVKGNTST
jgi:type VI secretion system secreted protein Hcp